MQDIYEISKWAVDNTLPELVVYLKLDPQTGLRRKTTEPDRIELEKDGFHEKVADAYAELARTFPDRFVVVDAARPPAEIHKEIVKLFEERMEQREVASEGDRSPTTR